jgi:hypothetical protein
MSYNFFYFSNFFCSKCIFLEFLDGTLFLRILLVFLLGLPYLNMTSTTLSTSFHIDLGRLIGDWTCIIQILE